MGGDDGHRMKGDEGKNIMRNQFCGKNKKYILSPICHRHTCHYLTAFPIPTTRQPTCILSPGDPALSFPPHPVPPRTTLHPPYSPSAAKIPPSPTRPVLPRLTPLCVVYPHGKSKVIIM
ncbi:hypothetical protein Pcinc_019461 [Petrolisthes cinctipes]|uniref:Uncharacterized protein n=1 Tax=Petrolisthes cinctipes TaxID=88211 RepID=A0AAE1FK81_PETCI|nr:hypothetical protein Pcinc_019461 [Petrolisthes cinctipes]